MLFQGQQHCHASLVKRYKEMSFVSSCSPLFYSVDLLCPPELEEKTIKGTWKKAL